MEFAETIKKSYWDKGDFSLPSLTENVDADIVLIGGGLAGLIAALKLSDSYQKIVILEGNKIGKGQTIGSSAIITYAHDLIYYRLYKKYGLNRAKKYYQLQKEGFEEIKEIIDEYNIDCDYVINDFILYASTRQGTKDLNNEYQVYQKMGLQIEFTKTNELDLNILKAIKIPNQATLNPYKFIKGLIKVLLDKGIKIYENALVKDLPKNKDMVINNYQIRAQKFIVTSHFPAFRFPGFYFLKMFQHSSHVIVVDSQNLKIENTYECVDKRGYEFRNINGRLSCLGVNIRTGKKTKESRYKLIKDFLFDKYHLTDYNIISEFSAQDCMSLDLLPYSGKYSHLLKDIYVISGFNKWGFTNSVACANELIKQLNNKKYRSIFSPYRFTIPMNLGAATKHLGHVFGSFFNLIIIPDQQKISNLKAEEGIIIRRGLKRIGVYKTKENEIKMIQAKCPHLGCSLNWNNDEKTWDCPCHGSRFNPDGISLLQGPALKNLKKIKDKKDAQ